jgi:hypothetical protein
MPPMALCLKPALHSIIKIADAWSKNEFYKKLNATFVANNFPA